MRNARGSKMALGGKVNARNLLATISPTLVLTLVWILRASGAVAEPDIPQSGETLLNFVPPDYEVEIEQRADFNGDGREDIAALLQVPTSITAARPLIVLISQMDGTYRLSVRTDHFTRGEFDSCGAGNPKCTPVIEAKGRALIIRKTRGTAAAGYEVNESEFLLISSAWYQVRQANYALGSDMTCSEPTQARNGERCTEQGVSRDLRKGVATKYCRCFDDNGKETRTVSAESAFEKAPLKLLTEVGWEDAEQ